MAQDVPSAECAKETSAIDRSRSIGHSSSARRFWREPVTPNKEPVPKFALTTMSMEAQVSRWTERPRSDSPTT
ncbi:hypothetical protein [Desulfitobacterium sp.]|uniref:hypothetical protein n=1 Tax=Desulfitobacterium sp. TaxID=49981 RepID=UPI002CBEE2DB|nr:hypothetical protein [Desulfitobacterium sp.]HVJ49797.1 hypothetical protein [Desulfitobacterium sp.]